MSIDMKSRMRCAAVGALVCLISMLGAGRAQAVSYAEFSGNSGHSSWHDAVGSDYLIENFNDDTLNPGLEYTLIGANHHYADTIDEGEFRDRVTPFVGSTLWTFETPIYAFGGFWDLTPNGPGTGINVYAGWLGPGWLGIGLIDNSFNGDFWGFVSDTPFTWVLLTAGGQSSGIQETYTLDNLHYAPVPEPGTMILLGSGVLGLALKRRRSA